MFKIETITKVTDELVEELGKLMLQLNPSSKLPTHSDITEVLNSPNTIVFIVRSTEKDNKIVGTLTLVHYTTPRARHAYIDDVVVDENERGQGIGESLINYAIKKAKELNADFIELTSKPSRIAANKLYQKAGFIKRETNVYRYRLN